MKIEEIEDKLPNGFRGSVLRKIIVRNRAYELKLYMDIDTGGEIKKGVLTIINLVYFVVNDSETDILGTIGEGIKISESGTIESLDQEVNMPRPYDEGAFRHYFYLPDFGEYIFVSGKDCEFTWEA